MTTANNSLETMGEKLARRSLEKDGDRYVPGQESVTMMPDPYGWSTARFEFVNEDGKLVLMGCWRMGDKWRAAPACRVVDFEVARLTPVPDCFEFSTDAVKLLEEARKNA